MAINHRDLLKNGREMVLRDQEVNHRNGANRVYYAAFHACRALLSSLEVDPRHRGQGSHQNVAISLKHFSNQSINLNSTNIKQIHRIGKELSRLIHKRKHADYDIHRSFPSTEAMAMLGTSSKIIDNVEKLLDMINSSSASNSNK